MTRMATAAEIVLRIVRLIAIDMIHVGRLHDGSMLETVLAQWIAP